MTILSRLKPAFCLAPFAFASMAHAVVVPTFTTMSSMDGFVGGGSFIIGAPVPNVNFFPAMKFTAQVDGELVSATATLDQFCCAGTPAGITFRLLADSSGTPAQVLASASAVAPWAGWLTAAPPTSGLFAQGVQITAGTTYWLGVAALDPSSAFGWSRGGLAVSGVTAFTGADWQQPGEWNYTNDNLLAAFRVDVASPVDEPSMALLLVLGVIPLALRLRSRASLS